ncbi:hypothetical protein [Aeromonas jandaei]|nr:hypothetical protein [Aeromonas jandaei]QWL64885.1 hypothetical protein HQ398_00875 [Aeromonas jandaei]
MSFEARIKMAIEAYCELTGMAFEDAAKECATNFDGPVNQGVLMLLAMAR